MRPLREQTALVTGATDGLGRALAGELASRGASILLHGRSHARLEEILREIREATGEQSAPGLPRRPLVARGGARAHEQAYDDEALRRLWLLSEELAGLATPTRPA